MPDEEGQVAVAEVPQPEAETQEPAPASQPDPRINQMEAQLQQVVAQNQQLLERQHNQQEQLIQAAIRSAKTPEDKSKLEFAYKVWQHDQKEKALQGKEQVIRDSARTLLASQLALQHGLDPERIVRLTKGFADDQAEQMVEYIEELGKATAAAREAKGRNGRPAMASEQPDSGGGAGTPAPSRQDILIRYRGTGDIVGRNAELRAHGYAVPGEG